MTTRHDDLYDRVLKASGACDDPATKRLLVDVAKYINDVMFALDNIDTKISGVLAIMEAYDV